MVQERITPEEAKAIELVWESRGNSGKPMPKEEESAILAEIRARVQEIEAHVVRAGVRVMAENRRTPRRHQRFAFCMIAAVFIAIIIVLWVRGV
jgi:hypothetical protein